MFQQCKEGKRPRQAYQEAAARITKEFDGAEQEDVELSFPSYKHQRRSLYRHAETGTVPVDDPHDLPAELLCTLRGRNADPGSQFDGERWLLYQAPPDDRPRLIFASDLDLEVLRDSHTWICDGTFKITPNGGQFSQVYNILGHGKFGDEVVLCVTAVLTAKTAGEYQL
jgi:hypothetical protein